MKNQYETPIRCTDDAIISGYLLSGSEALINGSASVLSRESGNGQILGFANQIQFRGIMVRTMLFLDKALFFNPILYRISLQPVE